MFGLHSWADNNVLKKLLCDQAEVEPVFWCCSYIHMLWLVVGNSLLKSTQLEIAQGYNIDLEILLNEKTFTNFAVLWLFLKVFSTKFEVWCPLARQSDNPRKFSPSKVSRYMVHVCNIQDSWWYVSVSFLDRIHWRVWWHLANFFGFIPFDGVWDWTRSMHAIHMGCTCKCHHIHVYNV